MAAEAKKQPAAGFGENAYRIDFFLSGKYVGHVFLLKNAFDAAIAQDRTDLTVHISSTIQALDYNTLTTIS